MPIAIEGYQKVHSSPRCTGPNRKHEACQTRRVWREEQRRSRKAIDWRLPKDWIVDAVLAGMAPNSKAASKRCLPRWRRSSQREQPMPPASHRIGWPKSWFSRIPYETPRVMGRKKLVHAAGHGCIELPKSSQGRRWRTAAA